MKKLLLLGDIHANYPALKAIQKYIKPDRFDRIINTGDFTVYSTFPNETIQWFRERKKTICILGNTDRRILRILKGQQLKKPRKKDKRIMYLWTSENLLPGNIRHLKSLPKQTDFTVGPIRIGVFHGTCDDTDEELFSDAPEDRFHKLAKNSPYKIHIMGHSHVPYHKVVDGVHFINPGSVGRMFDGDPRTSFAILKISSGKIGVEHFRIPYPVKEVVKSLKKHRLPDIYTKMFLIGKKLN
ncbi:MAG: metallophosphoesterase family protein [Deltaproteobacteria bacterium]|jgi:putative phosphoesterase|nr:metallophosphoesterase family protein [Deltaproteobacteria bacterium]